MADVQLAQAIGRLAEQKTRVVVDADKHAHQPERNQKQQPQALVMQMLCPGLQVILRAKPTLFDEIARIGQQQHKAQRGQQINDRQGRQRMAPAPELRHRTHAHAPQHATQCGATHVQAHGKTQALGVNFFRQIGHGHGRYAAKQNTFQRPGRQQRMPLRQKRGHQIAQRRQRHGDKHQLAPPQPFRQRARQHDGDRQTSRRHR